MKKILSLLALAGAVCVQSAFAQGFTLDKIWEKIPGDYGPFLVTNHLERGMAYNSATEHLLIPSRNDNNIHIIDAASGDYVGTLDQAGVVAGGTFLINKIAATNDGRIYLGNLVLDSSGSSEYRLYMWEDENGVPVRVFSGDPSNGSSSDVRWGDSLAVRGTGTDTEVLLGSYEGSLLVVLRPDSGTPTATDNYSAQQIPTGMEGSLLRNLAFGPDDLVYATRPSPDVNLPGDLLELEIDFDAGTVLDQRIFDGGLIARGLGPLGYGSESDVIAGVRPFSHDLLVYSRSHLSTEWTTQPVVAADFSAPLADDNYVENGNGTGEAIVVGNTIYAFDTNNGIMALELNPVEPGDIFWSTSDAIRTADLNGENPRTLISSLARPIGIAIDAANNHIYWAEDAAGRIARANLDGSNVVTIIDDRGDEENPDPITTPQGVVIVNDRLYWSEYSTGLYSANLDGSDAQHLIDADAEGTSAVAWDAVTGKIYMTATGGGLLYSVNPDGTGVDSVSFDTNTYGIAFDEAGMLFRTNFTGNVIDTYTLGSGATDSLFTERQMPLGIDVSEDGSQIFWAERYDADQSDGHIFTANADGSGEVTTLVSGESSSFGLTLMPTAVASGTFASWIAAQGVPVAQQGQQDDPDGDGVSNLLEYALGGSAMEADANLLPVVGIEPVGEDDAVYLSIAYTKNPDAESLGSGEYVVEVSDDLETWHSGAEHTTVVDEDSTGAIVRDNTPISDAGRRFIRLQVMEP